VGVVYDPNRSEIFVSSYTGGDIEVFSDSNNTQVADITALAQYAGTPYNLAYDSGQHEIWVADSTGAYAISDASNQVVANVTNIISSWGTLDQIAYDPNTGKVFVNYEEFTGFGSPYMQVISDSSNSVIANVTQAGSLFASGAFVDDSAKSEIFAAGTSTSDVYVISAQTNEVTNSIPVSGSPVALAYDSGKGEIFVGCEATGYSLQVISDSKNQVITTIDLPTSVNPNYMAYDPNKGYIYINDLASLTIISDNTKSIVGTVNTNGTAAGGIAYDSGTSTVYAITGSGSTETGAPGSLVVISDSTIPEFSSPALALIAAALAAATACTAAIARKRRQSYTHK